MSETFSSLERKLEPVLATSEQSRVNEVLFKVLADNLCVVNAVAHELGVEPKRGGFPGALWPRWAIMLLP
jgi:hypothetical protein